ncbi:unnamed protein product [Plutella xylostella]|uniref:(diamondback moth) hypothetical protein n=1 Tax=Plutella xylostella TaxID=51655 RepID=A0A8S4DLI9_PLUXY|nr:unnamed protein product [Plutella xylostella]
MAVFFWRECVLFLCIILSAASFNLEPRIPVIKFGRSGSYFGFSVAEHQTITDSSSTSCRLALAQTLNKIPAFYKTSSLDPEFTRF